MFSKSRKLSFRIKSNPGLSFSLKVLGLFLAWEILYRSFIVESQFAYDLCELLGNSATSFFSALGYSSRLENQTVFLNDTPVIVIGVTCNGLDFIGLFTCFILAFPAKYSAKIKFLSLGILLIHFLNMIRVLFLIANYYFFTYSFDFNHKYTFNIIIYGTLLLLWLWWARKQMIPDAQETIE